MASLRALEPVQLGDRRAEAEQHDGQAGRRGQLLEWLLAGLAVQLRQRGRITTRYTYTHRNGTTTVLAGLNTEITYAWDLRGGLLDNLTYSYGWNSRLTGVTDAAGSTGFSGDAETGTFSYSWSDKQTAATGYGVSGTVYDYQDRPLWLWKGGNQTKYRYDEAGNRLAKQTGTGDAEYYLWDGATTVAVFTATNAGTITDHYFNLIGSGGDVFGRDPDGSGTLYYYKDLLGTIRAVADGSNALVESYDYDPWGVEMEGRFTGAGVTKDGFTGKERDSESGFDYFGARHYMPAIGRWTGPDPMADKFPEWSTYNYVLGNPVSLTDPDGQMPDCCEESSSSQLVSIKGTGPASSRSAPASWKPHVTQARRSPGSVVRWRTPVKRRRPSARASRRRSKRSQTEMRGPEARLSAVRGQPSSLRVFLLQRQEEVPQLPARSTMSCPTRLGATALCRRDQLLEINWTSTMLAKPTPWSSSFLDTTEPQDLQSLSQGANMWRFRTCVAPCRDHLVSSLLGMLETCETTRTLQMLR